MVGVSAESTMDLTEQENRRKLLSYFSNHSHALYYRREGKQPPLPNEGQQPAHCGSMESNIFTIVGNWMKHNRTGWSVAGANNLAALLALHHIGQLRCVLHGWEAYNRPEGSGSSLTLPLSAAKANKLGENAYIPPHTFSFAEIHPVVNIT